jgi:hypothetical protein
VGKRAKGRERGDWGVWGGCGWEEGVCGGGGGGRERQNGISDAARDRPHRTQKKLIIADSEASSMDGDPPCNRYEDSLLVLVVISRAFFFFR